MQFGPVTPESDEVRDLGGGAGFDEQAEPYEANFPAVPNIWQALAAAEKADDRPNCGKRFATLHARLSQAGGTLQRSGDGAAGYKASRWGWFRDLCDLAEVADFAKLKGAPE